MLRQVLIWLLPVVTGVVRDLVGKPVPGARVTLGTAQATSNEQGEFTLVPANEGELALEVRAGGFEAIRRSLEIGGREEYHVRVEMPRLETLAYEVQVTGVAPRSAVSSSTFRQEEFNFQIVESPAQALRAVPGLLTAQHGGGGKADQ